MLESDKNCDNHKGFLCDFRLLTVHIIFTSSARGRRDISVGHNSGNCNTSDTAASNLSRALQAHARTCTPLSSCSLPGTCKFFFLYL